MMCISFIDLLCFCWWLKSSAWNAWNPRNNLACRREPPQGVAPMCTVPLLPFFLSLHLVQDLSQQSWNFAICIHESKGFLRAQMTRYIHQLARVGNRWKSCELAKFLFFEEPQKLSEEQHIKSSSVEKNTQCSIGLFERHARLIHTIPAIKTEFIMWDDDFITTFLNHHSPVAGTSCASWGGLVDFRNPVDHQAYECKFIWWHWWPLQILTLQKSL